MKRMFIIVFMSLLMPFAYPQDVAANEGAEPIHTNQQVENEPEECSCGGVFKLDHAGRTDWFVTRQVLCEHKVYNVDLTRSRHVYDFYICESCGVGHMEIYAENRIECHGMQGNLII